LPECEVQVFLELEVERACKAAAAAEEHRLVLEAMSPEEHRRAKEAQAGSLAYAQHLQALEDEQVAEAWRAMQGLMEV
jgi:hypothetical protein